MILTFQCDDRHMQRLEALKVQTGKCKSELLREGLLLVASYYEQNLDTITDQLTAKNVLEQLLDNLKSPN